MIATACNAGHLIEAWTMPVFQPGLVLGLIFLLLFLIAVWPRIRSWYRAHGRPVLDPLQLEELMMSTGALLVDLRSMEAYRRGHIRGSMHVPFAEFSKRFTTPDPKAARPMVLVDENDGLSHRAYTILTARGYTWVYVLKGGIRAWRRETRPMVK